MLFKLGDGPPNEGALLLLLRKGNWCNVVGFCGAKNGETFEAYAWLVSYYYYADYYCWKNCDGPPKEIVCISELGTVLYGPSYGEDIFLGID